MNNEIKEILDYLDYGVNSLSISKPPFKIEYEDIKKLLDYITNLQEQNQKYKEVIDKAIEYINKMFNTGFYNDDYYLGHLKQILQDKEVE